MVKLFICSAGYMRNFLYPRGYALYATPENVKEYGKVIKYVDETTKRIEISTKKTNMNKSIDV